MTTQVARRRAMMAWAPATIVALSVAGMAVSAYLTWIHWSGSRAFCAGVGDCEAVNTSVYSEVAGIPVALFGFATYAALFALGLAQIKPGQATPPLIPLALFWLALVGVLYSVYLTYIELFVLRAICPWCVTSALIITAIFVLSLVGLKQARSP